MDNVQIGKRIKYARDLRETTLEAVALKIGVAKSTVQRYENGKIQNIKLPVIESIGYALNVNPAWIIGKSEKMEIPNMNAPKIMEYYLLLNDIGKHEATKRVEELTHLPQYIDFSMVAAAHQRTDIEVTDEMIKHDDDIMNDDDF